MPPTRPTLRMSPAPAMPSTTVQKMIGAISILTSAMKPSPSGLSATPLSGDRAPMVPPTRMATSTQK